MTCAQPTPQPSCLCCKSAMPASRPRLRPGGARRAGSRPPQPCRAARRRPSGRRAAAAAPAPAKHGAWGFHRHQHELGCPQALARAVVQCVNQHLPAAAGSHMLHAACGAGHAGGHKKWPHQGPRVGGGLEGGLLPLLARVLAGQQVRARVVRPRQHLKADTKQ
jgi:hypothetical protein